MEKYLIKVVNGFDVKQLIDKGELTYYSSLDNILFLKTDLLAEDLLKIDGVLKVEESRVFRVGI